MTCHRCGSTLRHAEIDGVASLFCTTCHKSAGKAVAPAVRQSLEREMQEQVFAAISVLEPRCPDMRWIHHSPGEASSVARAKLMRRQGTRAGVLDIEWPLVRRVPDPFGGYEVNNGLAIELKVGKNQLTQAQEERKAWLLRQGWRVCVCRSAAEAVEAICAYAGLKDAPPTE